MSGRKPWTKDEVRLLRMNYNRGGASLLVPLLGRSWTAIRTKAQKLGVLQEKRTTWKTCPACRRTLLRAPNFYERSNGESRTRTEAYCKDCCAKRAQEWVKAKPDRHAKALERMRARHKSNRDKELESFRLRNRRVVDGLEPSYVAVALGLKRDQVPEPLLAAKREQLTLRRLARQLKEAVHESSQDSR